VPPSVVGASVGAEVSGTVGSPGAMRIGAVLPPGGGQAICSRQYGLLLSEVAAAIVAEVNVRIGPYPATMVGAGLDPVPTFQLPVMLLELEPDVAAI
jgi:hypothetical protein